MAPPAASTSAASTVPNRAAMKQQRAAFGGLTARLLAIERRLESLEQREAR